MIAIQKSHIRPLDARRDLFAIADLIELCFASQMDQDGWEYLKSIRRIAHENSSTRWIISAGERIPYPMNGLVWEEDGKIVGNLTLIPYLKNFRWKYLIANVAVHPDYRRRGIARQLTHQAITQLQDMGAESIWLQVRADYFPAYNLYRSLGFVDRAQRTTWLCESCPPANHPPGETLKAGHRTRRDWKLQEAWLKDNYPPHIAWYFPLNLASFRPNLWAGLVSLIEGTPLVHWSVHQHGQLYGTATWERTIHYADNLWLAASPQWEDTAVPALLNHARLFIPTHRPLAINYPAGRAVQAFEMCNFRVLNTLIWMEFDPIQSR
ncbi:MAG: GNAT family N-acetyltransferase [Chloroflexi bacterium]|nr:GNAT family N-acetyltransferase [Anaerolineaceae bacterium]NMB87125.1 GNAT family N-acetyltransferase [Chloroflexota bacterium]